MSVQIRLSSPVSFINLMKNLSVFREFWILEEKCKRLWSLKSHDQRWKHTKNSNVRLHFFFFFQTTLDLSGTWPSGTVKCLWDEGRNEWKCLSLKGKTVRFFYCPPGGSNSSLSKLGAGVQGMENGDLCFYMRKLVWWALLWKSLWELLLLCKKLTPNLVE